MIPHHICQTHYHCPLRQSHRYILIRLRQLQPIYDLMSELRTSFYTRYQQKVRTLDVQYFIVFKIVQSHVELAFVRRLTHKTRITNIKIRIRQFSPVLKQYRYERIACKQKCIKTLLFSKRHN